VASSRGVTQRFEICAYMHRWAEHVGTFLHAQSKKFEFVLSFHFSELFLVLVSLILVSTRIEHYCMDVTCTL
jgi:hypothetical protein